MKHFIDLVWMFELQARTFYRPFLNIVEVFQLQCLTIITSSYYCSLCGPLHQTSSSWVAGEQAWDALDVFSFSKRVANTFIKRGYAASSYDVKGDPRQDITSRKGFESLLALGLGFLCCMVLLFSLLR